MRNKALELARELMQANPDGITLGEFRATFKRRFFVSISKTDADAALIAAGLTLDETTQRYRPKMQLGVTPPTPLFGERAQPGEPGEYVIFDLETQGDSPATARIIQIAACKYRDHQPVEERAWFVAGIELDEVTELLTGITPAELAEKGRPLTDVLPEFLSFCGGLPLVGHNILAFDVPILNTHLEELNLPPYPHPGLDTVVLAQLLEPTLESYKLEELMRYFEGERHEDAHRADADVAATGRLLDHLRTLWGDFSPLEAATLARLEVPEFALLPSRSFPEPGEDDLPKVMKPVRVLAGKRASTPLTLERVFAHDGVLASHLASFEPRPPQVMMAQRVLESFEQAHPVIIEAPTGTGKTKGYLIPAATYQSRVEEHEPIIVSTFTKALQDQAQAEALELNAFGIAFRSAVFKGEANYLCLLKLQDLIDEADALTPNERRFVAYFLRWAQLGQADLERMNGWWFGLAGTREILHQLRTDSSLCTESCPFFHTCGFQDRQESVKHADVIISNHAATLTALAPNTETAPRHVIFDEGHNLEEAARSAFSETLERGELYALLAELQRGQRGHLVRTKLAFPDAREQVDEALALVERLRRDLQRFDEQLFTWATHADPHGEDRFGWNFELNGMKRHARGWEELRSHLADLRRRLKKLANLVRELPTDAEPRKRSLLRRFSNLSEDGVLDRLWAFDVEKPAHALILTVHTDGQHWRWERVPLDLRNHLHAFYESTRGLVLTSATLRIRKSFEHIQRALALETASTVALEPVLPYQNATIILPWHLPPPSRAYQNLFVEGLAAELSNSLTVTGGRSLALFAARDRMQQVGWRLKKESRHPVLMQGESARATLLERFRNHEETSLLGLRSMMEGIDVPGESLLAVHLEKIPFAVPNALERALQQYYADTGRDWWEEYFLPKGIIPFVQAFGRLIRTRDDYGAFVVWDRRITQAFYWEDFLDSLPIEEEDLEVVVPASRMAFFEALAKATRRPFDESTITTPATTPAEDLLERLRQQAAWSDGDLYHLLEELWGFSEFMPLQLEAIRAALEGRDVLLVLPTGGGKSLAFQLPALLQPGLTLVVSPLVSLMQDQLQGLVARGVTSAAALFGGQSGTEQADILAALQRGALRLLYVSPERLLNSIDLRRALAGPAVQRIVVDEAHCVSMWGHSFRPEYLQIREAITQLDLTAPVTAVTATATREVEDDIREQLALTDPVVLRAPVARANLSYRVRKVRSYHERDKCVLELVECYPRPVVVYLPTRNQVDRLYELLRATGAHVGRYRGGLPSYERDLVQDAFYHGELDVLVATKAYGMGVDKRDLRHVIHAAPPDSIESYAQEVGRAGRDRNPADGTLLYAPFLLEVQEFFIANQFPPEDKIERIEAWLATRTFVRLEHDASELGIDPEMLQQALSVLRMGGSIERMRMVPSRVAVRLPANPALPEDLEALLSTFDRDRRGRTTIFTGALPLDRADALYQAFLTLPRARIRTLEGALRLVLTGQTGGWRAYLQDHKKRAIERLAKLKAYVHSRECRHQQISKYFAEELPPCRDRCDNCSSDVAFRPSAGFEFDPKSLFRVEQRILETVRILEQEHVPVGRVNLVMILRGQRERHGRRLHEGFLRIPTYGVLAAVNEEDLFAEIERLLDDGKLHQVWNEHGIVLHTKPPEAAREEPEEISDPRWQEVLEAVRLLDEAWYPLCRGLAERRLPAPDPNLVGRDLMAQNGSTGHQAILFWPREEAADIALVAETVPEIEGGVHLVPGRPDADVESIYAELRRLLG